LSAAAVSHGAICIYQISISHEWTLFRGTGRQHDALLVMGMSVVWAISIFLYGASAASLGKSGTSVGWSIFIGMIVITSRQGLVGSEFGVTRKTAL
jgi:hypothetical protein